MIGSGLSGVACAKALLARGREVTMLDAGVRLPLDCEQSYRAFAARSPEQWTKAEKTARLPKTDNDVPDFKLVHGSDYPYQYFDGAPEVHFSAPGLASSFALGGLSNVWGSAMLPYRPKDIESWPVSTDEMAAAYSAVLSYVPLAGKVDSLAADWPLYSAPVSDMPVSRQIQGFLKRTQGKEIKGLTMGRARLAVNAPKCLACGECLGGCPYDLIYSARQELPALLAAGLIYKAGLSVNALEETAQEVQIHVNAGNEKSTIKADRVYLAAGVYNSANILMRSLSIPKIQILDSQYFLFPLLTLSKTSDLEQERLHTLAQVFMEIEDPSITPSNIHLQLYGYSSILDATMAKRLGPLRGLRNLLLERMLVVQGFLHSDSSGRLQAELSGGRLTITPQPNPTVDQTLKRILRYLSRQAKTFHAFPIAPLLQQTAPGRSYHCGGSFPMQESPRLGETDDLGRPAGWKRVHVVDASVLPTIPAATISLTIMANAYRIGHNS